MRGVGVVRVRSAVVAILCLVVAGACGSTVNQAARQTAGGGRAGGVEAGLESGGTGTEGGASASGGTDTGGSELSGGSGGSTGGGGTSSGGSSGGSGSGTGGSTGGGLVGPGVTATTINVGVLYTENAAAANAAIGAGGITQGDDRKNSQIVIDDINAHGGVLGRKLVPVYHALDATSSDTTDTQYQAACDDLTQDHKVFVAFAGRNEVFVSCLHKRGVIAVSDNTTIADTAWFRRYPYYYEITSLNLDRTAKAEVAALNAQKYFTGWNTATGQPGPGKAKVGVIALDLPSYDHAVDKVLIPELSKIGFAPDPADVVRVPEEQRVSDVGSSVAPAISNAVLKFRSDGVSHVIILERGAVLQLLFANNADSQHYYPRYGANTQTGQQALIDTGAYPQSQLNGTLGIGWLPNLDIRAADNPDDGPYSNEGRRKCVALYKSKGVTYEDANAETIALGTCNAFWFFRDALSRATGPNRDAFLASVNGLGTAYQSIGLFATRFNSNQHDGVAAIRHWAYKPECGCMRYTSGNIPVD